MSQFDSQHILPGKKTFSMGQHVILKIYIYLQVETLIKPMDPEARVSMANISLTRTSRSTTMDQDGSAWPMQVGRPVSSIYQTYLKQYSKTRL